MATNLELISLLHFDSGAFKGPQMHNYTGNEDIDGELWTYYQFSISNRYAGYFGEGYYVVPRFFYRTSDIFAMEQDDFTLEYRSYNGAGIKWDDGAGTITIDKTAIKAGTTIISDNPGLISNAWTHYALVRKNNIFYWFVNGHLQNSAESSVFIDSKTISFEAGGYYDEWCLTRRAKWTNDFEPPTEPYDENAEIDGYFPITEIYRLQSDQEIRSQKLKIIANGADYAAIAPAVGGYRCIGYQIDGGLLQNGSTATITNVQGHHIVEFIYEIFMDSYLVGSKVLYFNKIIFISTDGNDNNPGTEALPVATITKAHSLLISDNDAIVFLPGEYELEPIASSSFTSVFFPDPLFFGNTFKKVSYIGQGNKTVFYCDGTKATTRDGNLVGGRVIDLYRLNIKYKTKGGNYSSAICVVTSPATFYNCAIENVGSATMSINYYNGGSNCCSFYQCMLQSNGLVVGDYTGSTKDMTNCLLDWNYTNITTDKTNKLVRTIAADDYTAGSNPDLIAADESKIGVFGGVHAWDNSLTYFKVNIESLDENNNILSPSMEFYVEEGKDFNFDVPLIDGYSYLGYELDDDPILTSNQIRITDVRRNHNLILVYKEITQGGFYNLPAGLIMYFGSTTPPDGWLACDGRNVSRTQYSDLFAAIGTNFGAGDGATTFTLPDLRGEFVRGFDAGKGVDAGRTFGSKQKATVQAFDPTKTSIYMIGLYNDLDDDAAAFPDRIGAEPVDFAEYPGVAAAGTDYGTSVRDDEVCFAAVRPRNISLLPCIKY